MINCGTFWPVEIWFTLRIDRLPFQSAQSQCIGSSFLPLAKQVTDTTAEGQKTLPSDESSRGMSVLKLGVGGKTTIMFSLNANWSSKSTVVKQAGYYLLAWLSLVAKSDGCLNLSAKKVLGLNSVPHSFSLQRIHLVRVNFIENKIKTDIDEGLWKLG